MFAGISGRLYKTCTWAREFLKQNTGEASVKTPAESGAGRLKRQTLLSPEEPRRAWSPAFAWSGRTGREILKTDRIGKTKIEEHNCIRGRGLLQKLPSHEPGEVQRCEEMLPYGPTNLKVGLTPDEARAAKVRRSYRHVLKAVERVFRALAPEPYPLESSGYVP